MGAPALTLQLRENSGQMLGGAHDVHVTSGRAGGRVTRGQLGRGGEQTAAAWHACVPGPEAGSGRRAIPLGGGTIASPGLKSSHQPHGRPTGSDSSYPRARTMFSGQ